MRLLDRYLLRELLVPLGYCLGGFLLFWTVFDLFTSLGDLQEDKMHAGDIVLYYLLRTPEVLVLILPIALLLALLYALTTHARHHEITAMRAAGISLWRIALPYFVVGFTASLALLALNEFAVPDSSDLAERISKRRLPSQAGTLAPGQVRNLAFNNSRERRIWRIGMYDSSTEIMIDPRVVWTLPDGSVRWLDADRAEHLAGVWVFLNAREYREEPNANSMPMPILQTNRLALPEFTETPEQIKSEIKLSRSMSLRPGKRVELAIMEIVSYLRLHPNPNPAERDWLYTHLHGRLAAPWTCLVVVLIAIPFGAASGRRNVFFGVAGSIFICFTYFVLLKIGLALGSGGILEPWVAAWMPNLSFSIAGAWLTARVR
jgi:lipopolysaccharide export system permease protein